MNDFINDKKNKLKHYCSSAAHSISIFSYWNHEYLMITLKTTKGKTSILLTAFFKCKSDAPVYYLEGRKAGSSAVSIPTLENIFQNPFCKQRVVSQLLHSSRQILILIFQEISTTLKVHISSVLTCRFYLWKKSSNFFPFYNICDDMTWDLWVGSICNHYWSASLQGPQSCFHLQERTEPVARDSLVIWITTLNKTAWSTLTSRWIAYTFKEHSTHFGNLWTSVLKYWYLLNPSTVCCLHQD